eukprot:RCo045662
MPVMLRILNPCPKPIKAIRHEFLWKTLKLRRRLQRGLLRGSYSHSVWQLLQIVAANEEEALVRICSPLGFTAFPGANLAGHKLKDYIQKTTLAHCQMNGTQAIRLCLYSARTGQMS